MNEKYIGKATTVAELIQLLAELDPAMSVFVSGMHPYLTVEEFAPGRFDLTLSDGE
jgi:hypothetical protein